MLAEKPPVAITTALQLIVLAPWASSILTPVTLPFSSTMISFAVVLSNTGMFNFSNCWLNVFTNIGPTALVSDGLWIRSTLAPPNIATTPKSPPISFTQSTAAAEFSTNVRTNSLSLRSFPPFIVSSKNKSLESLIPCLSWNLVSDAFKPPVARVVLPPVCAIFSRITTFFAPSCVA